MQQKLSSSGDPATPPGPQSGRTDPVHCAVSGMWQCPISDHLHMKDEEGKVPTRLYFKTGQCLRGCQCGVHIVAILWLILLLHPTRAGKLKEQLLIAVVQRSDADAFSRVEWPHIGSSWCLGGNGQFACWNVRWGFQGFASPPRCLQNQLWL